MSHFSYLYVPFITVSSFLTIWSKWKKRDIGGYRKPTQILQTAKTTGRIPTRSAALDSMHQCSNFQTTASYYYYEKMIIHADPSESDSKEMTQWGLVWHLCRNGTGQFSVTSSVSGEKLISTRRCPLTMSGLVWGPMWAPKSSTHLKPLGYGHLEVCKIANVQCCIC